MRNTDTMTQMEAAALTHELVATRPDWQPAATMAALSRVHGTMERDQIIAVARAAAANTKAATLEAAFEAFQTPAASAPPAAAAHPYQHVRKTLEELQRESITRSIPGCYDDLSPELIAEDQFKSGVRKLHIDDDDGGPTLALRILVDQLRGGHTNADELDTALNILETRLCIPLTTAADGA